MPDEEIQDIEFDDAVKIITFTGSEIRNNSEEEIKEKLISEINQ